MGFRINTNIAALNAHSWGVATNRTLNSSLEKLSSGLRISKAADDASGLAIANSLRSQASALGQSIKNGNDAIGLIQTADGALSEYTNILDTIKTKSIQAASDGQNTNSRLAIQKDIDRLMEELDIIATTTAFNGQKLLSGTYTNKEFQVGAYANESVKASISSAQTNQVGHTSRADLTLSTDQGDVQLALKSATSGKTITLKSINVAYDNTPQNSMGALADEINRYSGETGISAKAVVSSQSHEAIKAGSTGSDFKINGIEIGAIKVSKNDNEGTLENAINNKTSQTGVTAKKTDDGKLVLQSRDGRAIKVEGEVSEVLGQLGSSLNTIGHIQLVQQGSTEFQIQDAGDKAIAAEVEVTVATDTTKDSVIAEGSLIKDGTELAQGSRIGFELTAKADVAGTKADSNIVAGSMLKANSVIKADSILGGKVVVNADAKVNDSSVISAGSELAANSVLGAGTTLTKDVVGTDNKTYTKGTTLDQDLTLKSANTFTDNMTVTKDTKIGVNSKLNVGSRAAADITAKSDVNILHDMTLREGSTVKKDSTLAAESTLGDKFTQGKDVATQGITELKAGSRIAASSKLEAGSNVGGEITSKNDIVLSDTNMALKSGSTLKEGTILKAGTVLSQDFTATQTGDIAFEAGHVLERNITLGADVDLTQDMVVKAGSTIKADSKLAVNNDRSADSVLGNEEFTNLSQIDVTTLEGAMKAIDTVTAAITHLDSIRSDLGSVQNQIVSTIANITTTQVNVKAAESQIRDVDFAEESANFAKQNILAQAGTYAMSQANAIQQNVLRLLQ